MNAQRVGLVGVRRATVQSGNVFPRMVTASIMQYRPASITTIVSAEEAQSNLAAQRLKRPVSPHLEVYKLEQTYLGASAWHRLTGAGLATGLYGFSLLYLVGPIVGLHLESASIAAAVATFPVFLKTGLKFLIAWPFSFHSFNGVRHLVMDLGYGFTKKAIFTSGWGAWGVSLVTALGLAMLW